MTQGPVSLLAGSTADASVPTLGASGAIAAVLGAYFVFYPTSRVLTLVLIWPVRIPAWFFLGGWFVYQLVEGNAGLLSSQAGGVAFFAHIGGFVFGVLVARLVAATTTRQPVLGRRPSTPSADRHTRDRWDLPRAV